jgi:hypothetical protein
MRDDRRHDGDDSRVNPRPISNLAENWIYFNSALLHRKAYFVLSGFAFWLEVLECGDIS